MSGLEQSFGSLGVRQYLHALADMLQANCDFVALISSMQHLVIQDHGDYGDHSQSAVYTRISCRCQQTASTQHPLFQEHFITSQHSQTATSLLPTGFHVGKSHGQQAVQSHSFIHC